MASNYRYRFSAVRGLERRKHYSSVWENVTGAILEGMTSNELRECANTMDTPTSTEEG